MRTTLYCLVAVALLAALAVLCVRHHVPLIADDLSTRARLALNDADLSAITIARVDGLNVVLTGTVPDTATRDRALAVVNDVRGVYAAIDALDVTPATVSGPLQFSALADRQQVTLTGMIRDNATRATIVGAARRVFTERQVIDQLTVVPSIPEAWLPVMRELLDELAQFSSGKLDIRGTHLSLVGSVASPARHASARSRLERVAGDAFSHRLDVAVLAPTREFIDNCQASLNAKLNRAAIGFTSGSATLSVDSHPLLEELAEIVAGCDGLVVEIQGHTDANGDDQINLRLSQQRAEAVRQHLIDEGVSAESLAARGFGESQPRADNQTLDGRARNRRIEFVIVEK
ncbi:MAG: OmpA family protein [Pseudomonadota bacterium]